MSHKSPFRPTSTTSAHPLTTASPHSSPSYRDLHASAHADDSSSDDELDPRWTNRRVAGVKLVSTNTQQQEGNTSASDIRLPLASTAINTNTSSTTNNNVLSSTFSPSRPNFHRGGFQASANPLDTSMNTTGTLGPTPLTAAQVADNWRKNLGDIDTNLSMGEGRRAQAGENTFSAIPAPEVDLTGMTEEQRELLEYYQARVDAFDRERVDFLQRLDEMSGNSREKHSLKWDLHKKDQQLMDLQKALSDAHVFLYEERAQVLKLTAENDRLKIQEMEDRQRLEHLLALTQPINQEVTYFRECRPEKLTKNYPGQRDDIYGAQKDMSAVENTLDSPRRQVLHTSRSGGTGGAVEFTPGNSTVNSSRRAANTSTSSALGTKRPATAGGKKGSMAMRPVVRTIYLPNENIDILKQIIASLRAQLTEQHTLFEQRIQALQEDRAIREQETAEVQRKANEHIQELAKELKGVNDLNKMTTRDYLELRHAAQLAERKLKERASQLSQQHFDLQKHLKEVEQRAAMSETALQNENASYVSMFRQQTAATEEDLAIMKAQYAATQDLYEKRIRYLESRITTLKTKLKTVTERRSLELEGYTTDITHMREKLRKLDHTLAQFKASQIGAIYDPQRDIDEKFNQTISSSFRRKSGGAEEKQLSPAAALPTRVQATFELLGEDVRQLQNELTQMARKINST